MLPDTITVPDHIAGTLRFETAPSPLKSQMPDLDLDPDVKGIDDDEQQRDLTARDRALLVMVAAIAADPSTDVQDGHTYIPDRPLRQILGMRTLRDKWEDARFDRFARSTMVADETVPDLADGVRVPTMTRGMRRRTVQGHHLWDVDERIKRSFSISPGDTVVEVPVSVLAGAKSRYTLTILLRVLAWGSGYHSSKWLRWKRYDHRVLRIPLAALRDDLGIDQDVKPADLLRKVLLPAVAEIQQFTDLVIDVAAWNGPSLQKGKVGRLMGIDIIVPVNGRVIAGAPAAPQAEVIAMVPFRAGVVDHSLDQQDEDIEF